MRGEVMTRILLNLGSLDSSPLRCDLPLDLMNKNANQKLEIVLPPRSLIFIMPPGNCTSQKVAFLCAHSI